MKKPKLKKYPTGGEKPTINTVDDYNKELAKYNKISVKKVPMHIAMYNQNVITPALKDYNSKLDQALREKYKLDAKAPIGEKQILTPMEATKVLGADNYKTYDSYRNAYNSYRDKTAWESRKPETLKFAPSIGDTTTIVPAYDVNSSHIFDPYPTFAKGGTKLPKYYNGGTAEPEAPAAYNPNYNAMIGTSSMATANYANVYQDPEANLSDKSAAGRQGAAQIVGSINPVVGGIISGVDAIAKPIKSNAERMDSQGNLENKGKARAGAIAGNILSPSTLATTISTGNWDISGNKYLNSLEADARAKIDAENAPLIAARKAEQNMYHTYAHGGVHEGMPNAEVEKQEVMRMPDGGTTQVDGPSHAQGGVPVNIPDGTQIFSDRLKDPTTKKTFAKMAEKYKTNKQDKVLADPKADKLSKSSAELVAQMKQRKLDELFQAQEQLKQAKLNKYASKLGINTDQFTNGGTKLPKYFGGGVGIGSVDPENLRLAQQQQYIDGAKSYSTREGSFVEYPDGQKIMTQGPMGSDINQPLPMITNQELENRNKDYNLKTGITNITPDSPSPNRTGNMDWVEPGVNTLMQNVGNLAYLKDQGKQYDKQKFYEYSPNIYNPADALRQADIEARVTRDRLKDASGGNAGVLMSNLQQSQALNTLNKSKIRIDAANMNNQVLNDAQLRNIDRQYMTDDINAKNKGQALTNYYKAIQGIGMNTSGAYRDYKAGKMDQNTAKMLSSMFQNYEADMNNPNDWEIVFKKVKSTKE